MFKKRSGLKNVLTIIDALTVSTDFLKQGREIPHLHLDASDCEELITAIKVHESTLHPGDVKTTWNWTKKSIIKNDRVVILNLGFISPINFSINIILDPELYGEIIDAMLLCNLVVLAVGEGELKELIVSNQSRLAVEIPDTASFPVWDDIYFEGLVRRYKKKGASKKEASLLARERIDYYRQTWHTKSFEFRKKVLTIENQ